MDIHHIDRVLTGLEIFSVTFANDDSCMVIKGRKDGNMVEVYLTPRDCGIYIDKIITRADCPICKNEVKLTTDKS